MSQEQHTGWGTVSAHREHAAGPVEGIVVADAGGVHRGQVDAAV